MADHAPESLPAAAGEAPGARELLEDLRRNGAWLDALAGCLEEEVWLADRAGRGFRLSAGDGLAAAGLEALDPEADECFRPDGSPRPPAEAPLLRALRGAVALAEREISRPSAGGPLRHREVSAAPVLDPRGEIVGAVAVSRDVAAEIGLRDEVRRLRAGARRREAGSGAAAGQPAQQRRLAAAIARAEQQERSRLAAVLHDDLQQVLTAARMHVEHARNRRDDPLAAESLDKALDLLGRALKTTRNLSGELNPPALHREGLAAVLSWLAGWMGSVYGLPVEVRLEGRLDPLPEPLRLQVFQAARELLFNIVKHAGSKQATLAAVRERDRLEVVVADRGCGFDPGCAATSVPGGGQGIARVRERAELLGGRLEIDSAPGRGTRCTLVVPVPGDLGV